MNDYLISPFKLAVLSLARRRVPTLITALSIAISVACSGMLLRLYHLSSSRFDSMGHGWETIVGAKAGGIEILLNALNGEGAYPDFLPFVLYQSLKAGQEVHFEDGQNSNPKYIKSVSPFVYFAKLDEFRAAGTTENFVQMVAPFSEGEWRDGAMTLGSQVAADRGLKSGDHVNLSGWLGSAGWTATVSGILKPSGSAWDRMLFTDVEQAQKVLALSEPELRSHSIWGPKVLHYFFINLEPGGFAPLQNLINKRTVGQLVDVTSTRAQLEELTGAGRAIGIFVSVFVILLSSLSVSSMLITRFDAMAVQLAVLRALGRSRFQIAQWLFWEGLLLGLAGCVLGGLIDALAFPFLRATLNSALPSPEVVASSVLSSAPIWGVALLATVAAIFIPMLRLYRQDVHQSLKG